MELTEQDIRNYMVIVKARLGIDLTYEAAAKEAHDLIALFSEFAITADNGYKQ